MSTAPANPSDHPGGEMGRDPRYDQNVTTMLAHLVRRTSVVLLVGGLLLGTAGPAGADTPEFWSDDPGYHVDPWRVLLVQGSIALLLFLLITLIVLLPGIIRGERFTPGGRATADQWFGGPRSGTAELPAPDSDESQAGGASGRW
jgi:hypothetical protein